MVDRTPLPDIKPCFPEFDVGEADRIGWIEAARSKAEKTSADTRFTRD